MHALVRSSPVRLGPDHFSLVQIAPLHDPVLSALRASRVNRQLEGVHVTGWTRKVGLMPPDLKMHFVLAVFHRVIHHQACEWGMPMATCQKMTSTKMSST